MPIATRDRESEMKRTRLVQISTVVLALMAVATLTGLATRVRMVNLVEMVRLSDRIFWGVCTDAREKSDDPSGLTVMEYTFQVRRGLKGVQAGDQVVFRQFQAAQGRAFGIPGLPRYSKGNEFLLFLHGDSRIGLTSPVGMEQGLFRLEEMEGGQMGVINSLQNANLAYELQDAEAQASGLARRDVEKLQKSSQPLPLDEFAALVDKIERSLKTRAEK